MIFGHEVLFIAGTAISQLDRTEMGCVTFPIWIAIVTGSIVLSLIVVAILINQKWNTIKFLLFVKMDILLNDDEPENVDEMEFDAFIAYR